MKSALKWNNEAHLGGGIAAQDGLLVEALVVVLRDGVQQRIIPLAGFLLMQENEDRRWLAVHLVIVAAILASAVQDRQAVGKSRGDGAIDEIAPLGVWDGLAGFTQAEKQFGADPSIGGKLG